MVRQWLLAGVIGLGVCNYTYADTQADAQAALDAKQAAKQSDLPKLLDENRALKLKVDALNKQVADLEKQVAALKADAGRAGSAQTIEKPKADGSATPEIADAIKAHTLLVGMTLADCKKAIVGTAKIDASNGGATHYTFKGNYKSIDAAGVVHDYWDEYGGWIENGKLTAFDVVQTVPDDIRAMKETVRTDGPGSLKRR